MQRSITQGDGVSRDVIESLMTVEQLTSCAEIRLSPKGLALSLKTPSETCRFPQQLRLEFCLPSDLFPSRDRLLFGRCLLSILSMLPPTIPEEARCHHHHSGEGSYFLKSQEWTLEMIITMTEAPLSVSLLGYEGPIDLSLADQETDLEELRAAQWLVAMNLMRRAQRFGVASQPSSATIDPSVTLHPSVEVSGAVEIGAKTRIWHFSKLLGPLTIGERCSFGQNVVIERGVKIGNNVKVQNNVSIYAGVILEDDVFCGPSMVFTNVGTPRSHYPRRDAYSVTRVGRGASIGANATIVCGHSLGRYCFVGAGAVVTKDVPDFALVYGNPARVKAWACYCGVKLNFKSSSIAEEQVASCEECERRYRLVGEIVTPLSPLDPEANES